MKNGGKNKNVHFVQCIYIYIHTELNWQLTKNLIFLSTKITN